MGRDKEVHAFPKSITLKVNLIARLEFELTYYNVAVQHISNYATSTLLNWKKMSERFSDFVSNQWFLKWAWSWPKENWKGRIDKIALWKHCSILTLYTTWLGWFSKTNDVLTKKHDLLQIEKRADLYLKMNLNLEVQLYKLMNRYQEQCSH